MRQFLASDVLYARAKTEIEEVLAEEELPGEVPSSTFLPEPVDVFQIMQAVGQELEDRIAAERIMIVLVLVIGEDVQHRPPLVAQLAVRDVQVAHDVQERPPTLLRLAVHLG